MTLVIDTHKNILLRISKKIYSDLEVGPHLGFKGGTAAYLFYDLERFSVDLDFDLLNKDKEDLIYKRMQAILAKFGTIKTADRKRHNLLFILSYNQKIEGATNVKVEINRRDFGSRYEVKTFLGISMKVMVPEDMFAHKLVAMLDRIGKTNRDIYDVWFFFKKHWPINEEIIMKRTGLSTKDYLKKCIKELEKDSNRNILSGIGELLDAKQKAWVKEKLMDEVLFYLRAY